MSNISYDWIVLGVAAILFAVLSFLKRKKNAGFTTRVLLATVFGIILGIAFKGHTDYVGAVGSIWSNAITALAVPLLLFSIISSITNLGESIRLKNIGAKTVFFLLLNTATASLLTLILAQAFQLGVVSTTPCRAITNNMTFLPFSTPSSTCFHTTSRSFCSCSRRHRLVRCRIGS